MPRTPDWWAWIVAGGRQRGGLNLGGLFHSVLNLAYDRDSITEAEAFEAVHSLIGHQFKRMRAVYKGEDLEGDDAPVVCVRDALAYLVFRGFLVPDQAQPGRYLPNRSLPAGQPLDITTRHVTDGVPEEPVRYTIVSPEERAHLTDLARLKERTVHAASRLRPDSPGLRPVNQKRVQEIVASVNEYGLRDDAFPVLLDRHGRILSGRHRLGAAKLLGVEWKTRTLDIDADEDALAVAWVANLEGGWSANDEHRLAKLDLPPGVFSVKDRRKLIELELLRHPTQSNRQIAEEFRVSHHTVQGVRELLEATGQVAQLTPGKGGRGPRERTEVVTPVNGAVTEPTPEPEPTPSSDPEPPAEPAPTSWVEAVATEQAQPTPTEPEPAPEPEPAGETTGIAGYVRTDRTGKRVFVSGYKGRRGKAAAPKQSQDDVTSNQRALLIRLVMEDGLPIRTAMKEVGLGVTLARRIIDQERGRREALATSTPPPSQQPTEEAASTEPRVCPVCGCPCPNCRA